MKKVCYLLCVVIAFTGCQEKMESPTISEEPVDNLVTIDYDKEEKAILSINKQILEAMVVHNDDSELRRHAHPNLRVIAPGGKVENLEDVIRGVNSLDAKSISLSEEEVIFFDDTAVLNGKMEIDGTMIPLGKLGPAKYMAVFILENGEWKLVSRSITPCAKMAIDNGFC